MFQDDFSAPSEILQSHNYEITKNFNNLSKKILFFFKTLVIIMNSSAGNEANPAKSPNRKTGGIKMKRKALAAIMAAAMALSMVGCAGCSLRKL